MVSGAYQVVLCILDFIVGVARQVVGEKTQRLFADNPQRAKRQVLAFQRRQKTGGWAHKSPAKRFKRVHTQINGAAAVLRAVRCEGAHHIAEIG